MNPRVLVALAVVAIGMFGYAVLALVGGPAPGEARSSRRSRDAQEVEPTADTEGTSTGEHDRPRRELPLKGMRAAIEARQGGTGEDGPGQTGVATPATLSSARTAFEATMEELHEIANSRVRLTQEEWEEHYRVANDAFAALSAHLEPDDPKLETAHRMLQRRLAKLRVKGKRRNKKHRAP